MHYYQFNIGDYASHTQHLDPLEDIAYRRMIDWCYLNEMPLPDDVNDIARLVRMRPHCDCIEIVLREFFTLTDDGYIQARIQSDLDKYRDKSEKARKSAKARWDKTPIKDGDSSYANALRPDSERNANHKPITNNQEPPTKEIKTIDHSANDHLFEMFWKSGMNKVNKKKSKSLFNNLLKKQADPDVFTKSLCNDVSARLAANQLGFAEMHPTTYLNGERWTDEVKPNGQHQQPLAQGQTKRDQANRQRAADLARIQGLAQQPHVESGGVLELHGDDVRGYLGQSEGADGQ